jgi:hydrogenase 3 maturation protease
MEPLEPLEALSPAPEGLTLIITVGNSLRGDDGVGPYIASQVKNPKQGLHILDAADRPEDCIDAAVALHPLKTVVLDAADFGGSPGEARVIPQELIPNSTLSTHTFPLKIITKILEEETGSSVFYIGIQPENVSFGRGLSDPVQRMAKAIIHQLDRSNADA